MLQAACGDLNSYRELFERHYKRSVNIAYRMLGNHDIAEDIAMDAFVKIWESRTSYKASAKFSTYLYRVTLNLCINSAKRKCNRVECRLHDYIPCIQAHNDPPLSAQLEETTRVVQDAVFGLPENQRTAIVLTRYEELSYEATSEIMGVSVKAVESLLHRAKQNLRNKLSGFVMEK